MCHTCATSILAMVCHPYRKCQTSKVPWGVGFPRCRDFGKKSGIVICDSRPGNSREFHLFCLEFMKMRASEFFLKSK